MKATRKQPERALHTAVAELLDYGLPSDAAWFPVPNGAHMKSPRHAAMMKRSGQLKAGVPDIGIIWAKRALFIELKAGRNDTTDAQVEFGQRLTLAGAVVCTCRSLDEVRNFLATVGVPMRARVA